MAAKPAGLCPNPMATRMNTTRLSALALAATLAVAGCRSTPNLRASNDAPAQAPSADAPVAAAPAGDLPPLAVAPPLPPAPVPATFDVADLAERVKPTVVNITTKQKMSLPDGHPFEFFFGPGGPPQGGQRTGAGTGFVIDPAGYVVTNEHVVHEADEVRVRLADEREFEADVVGRDPKLDLALLKLRGAESLPSAQLGTSERLRIGEHVLAVGNPFGLGHTVTLGIVSAKARSIGAGPYDDFIQTDAAINPGNSGGPLFNWRGEVVGINTAIRPDANSIGFAIPVDALRDILPQLRDRGHVVRGKLGLLFQPISADLAKALGLASAKGALISQTEPGGAAERAGLAAGDVIVAINDVEIAHGEELPRNVARNAPGAKIKVVYVRGGKRGEVTAVLDTLDDEGGGMGRIRRAPAGSAARNEKLGLQVSDARGGGARIEGIAPGSPAEELRPGDVIVELDGKPVKDVASLERAFLAAKPGSVVVVRLRRGDGTRFAALPVPSK
jgi:serine protease Do